MTHISQDTRRGRLFSSLTYTCTVIVNLPFGRTISTNSPEWVSREARINMTTYKKLTKSVGDIVFTVNTYLYSNNRKSLIFIKPINI